MSFDPSQPRDNDGKWAQTGAAGQRLSKKMKNIHQMLTAKADSGDTPTDVRYREYLKSLKRKGLYGAVLSGTAQGLKKK